MLFYIVILYTFVKSVMSYYVYIYIYIIVYTVLYTSIYMHLYIDIYYIKEGYVMSQLSQPRQVWQLRSCWKAKVAPSCPRLWGNEPCFDGVDCFDHRGMATHGEEIPRRSLNIIENINKQMMPKNDLLYSKTNEACLNWLDMFKYDAFMGWGERKMML